MSKGAVNQVIQRAIGDAAFRRELQHDPGKALAGLELTKDERSAITSGDPGRLMSLGVDQRMSKAFTVGGLGAMSKSLDAGGSAAASKAISPDVTGVRSSAFIDEGGAGGSAAIIDAGEPGGSLGAMNLRRIEGDLNVAGAVTEGSGSAIRDAHDTLTGPTGSTLRDAHDSSAYAARADVSGGSAIRDAHDTLTGPTGSTLRDAHDSSAYAARADADAGGSLNASNLRRVEGDLNTGSSVTEGASAVTDPAITEGAGFGPSGTAFEPQDASLDLSTIDPGFVSGDSAAIVTDADVDAASLGQPGTMDGSGNAITE